ncbi:MAG TPA: c-type cytochrome [Acidobacteriaceae bacterium]
MTRRRGILHTIGISIISTFVAASIPAVCWAGSAISPNQDAPPREAGEKLIQTNDCSSCHAADQRVVGPSYNEIAKRYKGQAGIVDKLAAKVKRGGSGNWGTVPMIPHPALTDGQLKEMVVWILSLGSQAASSAATNSATNIPKVHEPPPGERVFMANCSRCHMPPMTLSPRITGTVIMHMRTRARLSKEDQEALLKFLAPK